VVGDAAPDLAQPALDGRLVRLGDYRGRVVVVDFWATWCGPCLIIAPVLEQLASEYAGKIKVAKVDVDTNQATAMKFNIRSIPAVLFFKGGKHVDTVIGAVPKSALQSKIQQHL
jgi:thioredoxin 1